MSVLEKTAISRVSRKFRFFICRDKVIVNVAITLPLSATYLPTLQIWHLAFIARRHLELEFGISRGVFECPFGIG